MFLHLRRRPAIARAMPDAESGCDAGPCAARFLLPVRNREACADCMRGEPIDPRDHLLAFQIDRTEDFAAPYNLP